MSMRVLRRFDVYCTTVRLTGDRIPARELAPVLLSLCPRLLKVKPNARYLLVRVVDTSKKTRWIVWARRSIVVQTSPVSVRRSPRSKTLRIDWWSLNSPSLRKRRSAVRRRS